MGDIKWPLFDFANFPNEDRNGLASDANRIICEILKKQPVTSRMMSLQSLQPSVVVAHLKQSDDQLCISTNSQQMWLDHVIPVLNVWRMTNNMERIRM
jgi:hypothetical protein